MFTYFIGAVFIFLSGVLFMPLAGEETARSQDAFGPLFLASVFWPLVVMCVIVWCVCWSICLIWGRVYGWYLSLFFGKE